MPETIKHRGVSFTIQDDGRLEATKEQWSLFWVMAEANTQAANKLSLDELWAVALAIKMAPFPGRQYVQVYQEALQTVREHPEQAFQDGTRPTTAIGKLRLALVAKAGDGCNAPTDSYLHAAVEAQDQIPASDPAAPVLGALVPA